MVYGHIAVVYENTRGDRKPKFTLAVTSKEGGE